MSVLPDEQMALMPTALQDKYIKSAKKSFEQRCEDHFEVYMEHLKLVLTQNHGLKEKVHELEQTIEDYKIQLDQSKANVSHLEDGLRIHSRQGERLELKCLKLQDKIIEKEKLMSSNMDNLQRSIRGEHEREVARILKKHETEIKLASTRHEKSLARQQEEAQLNMDQKEEEINELKASIEQQNVKIRDHRRTIAVLESTMAEEKEHYEELAREEKLKAEEKVEQLEEELEYLKVSYEAFMARNVEKEISGLKDTVTRKGIIVQQREEEVEVAKRETDKLHNIASYVEMANVELNLRLIHKTKKLSKLESKYQEERARHKETRVQLTRAENEMHLMQQEHKVTQRKASSLEKETLMLQQKLRKQQDLYDRFQLDLQGCVDNVKDRPKFQRKFRELARNYLDKDKAEKLRNLVQECEEKLDQMRSRTEYVKQSVQHENKILKDVVRKVEDKHVASFLELKYYTNLLVEDLGVLRDKCKPQHLSRARPAEEKPKQLDPAPRAVKCLDCVPTYKTKQTQYRGDPEIQPASVGKKTSVRASKGEKGQTQQDSQLPRVTSAKATPKVEEPEKTTALWDGITGKALSTLPPIKGSRHLTGKQPDASSSKRKA